MASKKKAEPTSLSELEMVKLELEAEREKVRKLTEKAILAENDKLALEEKLLHAERKNVSHRYMEVRRVNDVDRGKREEFMKELKDKFGVPHDEGLGYDPMTGDIIREDK